MKTNLLTTAKERLEGVLEKDSNNTGIQVALLEYYGFRGRRLRDH